MRRVIVICLIVFCLFYRVRPASNVSERMSSPQETDDCPAAAAIKSAHTAADRERLESLLDGILLLQPCSAGNTFRVAALGGGFYHWYMETPRASEAAKQAALAWGSKRTREERQQYLEDVNHVAETLHRLFHPDKINFGAYGDTMHHLHFHLVPKYRDGYEWGGVFAMNPGQVRLTDAEYQELVSLIAGEL